MSEPPAMPAVDDAARQEAALFTSDRARFEQRRRENIFSLQRTTLRIASAFASTLGLLSLLNLTLVLWQLWRDAGGFVAKLTPVSATLVLIPTGLGALIVMSLVKQTLSWDRLSGKDGDEDDPLTAVAPKVLPKIIEQAASPKP